MKKANCCVRALFRATQDFDLQVAWSLHDRRSRSTTHKGNKIGYSGQKAVRSLNQMQKVKIQRVHHRCSKSYDSYEARGLEILDEAKGCQGTGADRIRHALECFRFVSFQNPSRYSDWKFDSFRKALFQDASQALE